MPVKIAPSILTADFANLETELGRIAGADMVHVDVMDGHFVPNLTLGLPVVQRLVQVSPLPLDIHLMIEDPDRWAPDYAQAGAASVTFHYEAAKAPVRLARTLRQAGAKVGVAVNPATPVMVLEDLMAEIDMILVMSVEPGFGGQGFIDRSLAKLAQARALAAQGSRPVEVQVDGGADRTRIARIVAAGATVVVAGSAVFNAEDPGQEVQALRQAAAVVAPDAAGQARPATDPAGQARPAPAPANQAQPAGQTASANTAGPKPGPAPSRAHPGPHPGPRPGPRPHPRGVQ
jgi:ribulose-phosphate 3-epimerase